MIATINTTMLPLVAGRITRNGERSLGPFRLDREMHQEISANQLSLFISGVPSYQSMLLRVAALSDYSKGRWIAVLPTKVAAVSAHAILIAEGLSQTVAGKPKAGRWQLGHLEFATVEQLAKVDAVGVEGVILLDPTCMVHKARDYSLYNGNVHDRPQRIVNFLATAQRFAPLKPAFALMTCCPALALPTARIASIYCLEGWQFLEGTSTRFAL